MCSATKPGVPTVHASQVNFRKRSKCMSQSQTSHSGEVAATVQPAGEQNRWLAFYEQMLKIRIFEEHVNQLYVTARMPGLAHLYIGEEAIAVGVCAALRR